MYPVSSKSAIIFLMLAEHRPRPDLFDTARELTGTPYLIYVLIIILRILFLLAFKSTIWLFVFKFYTGNLACELNLALLSKECQKCNYSI